MAKRQRDGGTDDVGPGGVAQRWRPAAGKGASTSRMGNLGSSGGQERSPGKRTLTQGLAGGGVSAEESPAGDLESLLCTPAVPLPYRTELEPLFGVDLGDIEAHVGEVDAVSELGGVAAAEGSIVAFAEANPTRETVAHEVTHAVQADRGTAGGAPAEGEADRIEARVAAGMAAGPINQGASGVHLKNNSDAPPVLTARAFLRELFDIQTVVLHSLFLNKVGDLHPYAPYLRTPEVLLEVMFGYGSPASPLLKPFDEKIEGLIAPEPLEVLVDNARRIDAPSTGGGVGPAHHIYMDSVGFALGNALSRRFRESLTRMLPRYVAATRMQRDADGVLAATAQPRAADLTATHPLDRVVAHGLCAPELAVEAVTFAEEHPALVQAADRPQGRQVALRFPYERNLWHWVEASPPDASPEEVARALFGNEDQAFRLTPMAPLFGFRGADVAAFVPERRRELDELAAQHHPSPDVLNQADIAAHEMAKEAREREAEGTYQGGGGDPMDAGVPPPAGVRDISIDEPDPDAPAKQLGYPTYDAVDPAVELAAAGGNRLAIERARLAAGSGDGKRHDEPEVHERLGDCLDVLETVRPSFAALELSTDVLDAQRSSFLARQHEAREACLADADGAYLLADEQAKTLRRIAKGSADTSAHMILYGGVNREEGGAVLPPLAELPPFARAPIVEAGAAYASAADALAFPELAGPRLDHAEQLTRTLRITALENSLNETLPAVQDAMDSPGDRQPGGADYDPADLHTRSDHLLAELSMARVQMESDPAAAEKQLGETQARAGDYTFEVAVVRNLEALDRVWKIIEDTEDFWKSGFDELVGDHLQAKSRGFYGRFKKEVLAPYKKAVEARDEAGKETARKAFKGLVESEEFKTHFEEVQEHLEDDASHKKWTKIIVGIGIAVVAMGLGQWYFAGYLAAGGGLLAASVGAAVVETGTSAILNKLILDVDPTAGSLITGFVGAGAMYGVVGRTLAAGRAIGATAQVTEATVQASALAKVGKLATATTKELLLVQAIGLVQGEIANLIDHGELLTEAQVKEMFVHNIAGLIGMKIGQRVVDVTLDPMKPLRDVGKRHSIDVDALITERDTLEKLAAKVKDDKDPSLAQDLIEREQRFLESERDVRERLIELGKAHPEQVPAGKLAAVEAMPERGVDAEVMQAQALMSIEEVGPGLYRADARAFDALLSLHKQSGDRLVGVHTDPHTGVRTLEVETTDGARLKIKEKLAQADERTGPPVPVAEAERFEKWLESEPLDANPAQSEVHRQRLREYYARDPQGAIALAGRYGFQGTSVVEAAPLAKKPTGGPEHPAARSRPDSDRAYDQFLYEERGADQPKTSRIGDEPAMDRGGFEEMYKAGFEYDPVARRWVPGTGKTTSAGRAGAIPDGSGGSTQVLGSVHSEAVGHELVRKLVSGEAEALRLVGIEPPPGFDTRGNEWALGRRRSDGHIVLIRGAKGEVDWSRIPDVEDIGHSHPLIDPVTGQERLLQGPDGTGIVDLNALGGLTYTDLLYLMPSTGDARFVALGGRRGHRVYTPYVSLGGGKIGNPTPGHALDTVEIVIAHSEPHALLTPDSEIVIWKAQYDVYAGDKLLGSLELYQRRHVAGSFAADMLVLHADPSWAPLPADHPILKAAAAHGTPASNVTDMGYVDALTVQRLMDRGLDPTLPEVEHLLFSLNKDQADALRLLVDESLSGSGRVVGKLDDWLARLRNEAERPMALHDARLASLELGADPATALTIGADGKLTLSNPGARGKTATATRAEELLHDRGVPKAVFDELVAGKAPLPSEAVLIDLARTWHKLDAVGLRKARGDADTIEVLRALTVEQHGPRILEIIGSGRFDQHLWFSKLLSQLYTPHNRSTLIVVLERGVELNDPGMVFEPLKEGERPANETRSDRKRRAAAEASGRAPKVERDSDADLAVPDGRGGWKTLYQMKYIEANPTSAAAGQTVRPVADRVKDAADKGAKQLQLADKAQTDAGKAAAEKIVEIRAEAPRGDLDPPSWKADFEGDYPGVAVHVYSTEGGAPWIIGP